MAGAALAVLALTAGPAQAAPPPNDAIEDARVVRAVPTTIVQDTSEATSSPDDGECVLGASTWYRYQPSADERVRITTVSSSYNTVLAVFSGPPDARTLLACSDDAVVFWSAVEVDLQAGETYWIAVSACCAPEATGGRTVLSLYPPRSSRDPVTRVTDASTGVVSGRLYVEGTIACTRGFATAVFVSASQRVRGGGVARADTFLLVPCSGTRREAWAVALDSATGRAFQARRAVVTTSGEAFDGFAYASVAPRDEVVDVDRRPGARASVSAAPVQAPSAGDRRAAGVLSPGT